MKIDGYFTSAEIKSAINCGASIEQLNYGQMRLTFETAELYDLWMKQSPSQWELALVPREPALVP